ncbi:hypothetical protein ASD86_19770 [Lysobacter sp. Root690]|nr:hypothetical protein ASD86_19770 [Lysobacter sp. Root690]
MALKPLIPAFAGMTIWWDGAEASDTRLRGTDIMRSPATISFKRLAFPESVYSQCFTCFPTVIPAKAGIQCLSCENA